MMGPCIQTTRTLLLALTLLAATGCDAPTDSGTEASVSLDPPALLYPESEFDLAPTTIVLAWQPVEHALQYEVEWELIGNTSARTSARTDGLSHVLADLPVGQTVIWRVRSWRGPEPGPWSDERSFTAITPPKTLRPPQLSLPFNGQDGMQPWAELAWEPVPGALSYHVQVTIDEAMILFQADTEGLEEPELHLPSLIYTYPYWWKVRTLGPSGYSEWSPVWIFTIRDEP